jgi:hypothetical protein
MAKMSMTAPVIRYPLPQIPDLTSWGKVLLAGDETLKFIRLEIATGAARTRLSCAVQSPAV